MSLITAIIVGVIYSGGFYLLLRRNMFEVLLGILLLSQGANIMLVSMGGWDSDNRPPVLTEIKQGNPKSPDGDEKTSGMDFTEDVQDHSIINIPDAAGAGQELIPLERYADPLPQALVLTAIVIGFGLMSFMIVLLAQCYEKGGSLEVGEIESQEDAG